MIIDFTHTIVSGMAVYPGSPSPVIEELENYDYQGVHVQKITMEGHTGTHIDAPSHLFPDGRTADLMELSAYYGTAQIIDCSEKSGKGIIESNVLEGVKPDKAPDFLLLYTGWDVLWGTQNYYEGFPVPSTDFTERAVDMKLKGIGIDTASIDAADSRDLPNHRKILGANMIIIENLTGLAALAGTVFRFCCFPLKIKDGDGSPVRAAGIINE